MKKFGICPSNKDNCINKYVIKIIEYLQSKNIDVLIDRDFSEIFSLQQIDDKNQPDVIVSLGGDGTLLLYKRKYSHFEKTIFTAANLGKLGFMADVNIEKFEDYFEDIFNGQFNIEERLMLEWKDLNNKSFFAVNDFVFHRGSSHAMIELKVLIDSVYFNTFQADGLIIATPTGSTAYTLAAGGPLVHPTIQSIIMTPICGHALSNRPFISHSNNVIEVQLVSTKSTAEMTIDGIDNFIIHPNQTIKIFSSQKKFKLISYYKKHTFFSTLRDKLHWKGIPHGIASIQS